MDSSLKQPIAVSLTAIIAAACATTAWAAAHNPRNAVWAEHDLRFELQQLPRIYSCDELTSKIHDVLQTLGARADVRIFATRCANGTDARRVAPRVHAIFFLPLEVRGRISWSADLFALARTVRIEPGNPQTIDSSDCELLRQLEMYLLRPASLNIDSADLSCRPVTTQHSSFSLSIEALMPEANGPAKVSDVRFVERIPGAQHG